jgi:hypothetical protein
MAVPLFVLCLLTPLVTRGATQSPRETQLHQMIQVENSNKAVSQFLRGLHVPFKSDTVYLFMVPPMTAARIEGAISPFIRHLRKAGVNSDIITLAISGKKRAAEAYLKRRAFTSDYNLVTDEKLLNSFVFSAGNLQTPFVAKFSVKSGDMLSSYSLMGSTDSATVAWFIADLSKPKAKRPVSEKPRTTMIETDAYKPAVARRLKLADTDEYPLSTTYYVSVNPSGTRFALWDKLSYNVYVFDLGTGRLLNSLFPDSAEEMKFIAVPPPMYQGLKRNNIVNSMYLNQSFCDDATLLITASLPSITMAVTNNDTNVSVANSPVFIRKGIADNRPLGYVNIQHLPDGIPGAFSHGGASLIPKDGLMFLPYLKGWPSGTEVLNDSTPPQDNPFADEFYQKDLYQFAAYTLDGAFAGMWGRLSPRFEALRLGYLSHGGLVKSRDGKYYLSDQYSGKTYVYNKDASLHDSIKVFDDPPLVFPDIDRTKEPLRYLLETFKQNFRARIVDFLVTDDYCYALVLWDESQPIVYKVGLKDNTARKYALPARFEGKEAKHYLLRETPSGITTVSLLESGDETWYCEFKIP